MKLRLTRLMQLFIVTGLTGSPVFLQQPLLAQGVRVDEKMNTPANSSRTPLAKEKIVVAVYTFRNLSDRSIQAPLRTSSSAAPNYTRILFDMLQTSGWFDPIEYTKNNDGLSGSKPTSTNPSQRTDSGDLSSAPTPAIFLESGILSYDASMVTDKDGHHFFSDRDTEQYNQDRVTVYLRVLSAKTGKILKTIYSSKTILSQLVSDNAYRYISFRQPLEAETGQTTTQPGELAVLTALDKAVQGLIIEGVRDGLWPSNNLSPLALKRVIDSYEQEKMNLSESDVPGVQPQKKLWSVRPQMDASRMDLQPYVGLMRYSGDYTQRETTFTYGLSLDMYVVPVMGIQLNAATGILSSQDAFSINLTSLEVNALFRPLPFQRWTPILYAGVGMVSRSGSTPFQLQGTAYGQAQEGIGVQFSPNKTIGFRSMLSFSQPFTDALDGQVMGDHNDYYRRITLGLVIHMGRFPVKTTPIKFIQVNPKGK